VDNELISDYYYSAVAEFEAVFRNLPEDHGHA